VADTGAEPIKVVEHWVAKFVGDSNRWLEENCHPLRCMLRDINRYGLPGTDDAAGGYRDLNTYGRQ
jgi:hypothetical protein